MYPRIARLSGYRRGSRIRHRALNVRKPSAWKQNLVRPGALSATSADGESSLELPATRLRAARCWFLTVRWSDSKANSVRIGPVGHGGWRRARRSRAGFYHRPRFNRRNRNIAGRNSFNTIKRISAGQYQSGRTADSRARGKTRRYSVSGCCARIVVVGNSVDMHRPAQWMAGGPGQNGFKARDYRRQS